MSKVQASYLSKLKDELKDNEVIVLIDFAENYSFVAQDVCSCSTGITRRQHCIHL